MMKLVFDCYFRSKPDCFSLKENKQTNFIEWSTIKPVLRDHVLDKEKVVF